MVNGKIWPNMNVDQGSIASGLSTVRTPAFYTLGFSNGMSFTQIGSDGGYLRAPVKPYQHHHRAG